MNREESLRALEQLAASPAAQWIGNKIDGGTLIQKCTRCGTEEKMTLPAAAVAAFASGKRGDALASQMPSDFDEKLYAWKRAFQVAHEGCTDTPITAHAYLSAGDTAAASGDRAYTGCFLCGRPRREHAK